MSREERMEVTKQATVSSHSYLTLIFSGKYSVPSKLASGRSAEQIAIFWSNDRENFHISLIGRILEIRLHLDYYKQISFFSLPNGPLNYQAPLLTGSLVFNTTNVFR